MIVRTLPGRALILFLAWIVVAHHDPDDFVVGLIAAVFAAWVSLRLLPAGALRPRALPAAQLAGRVVAQAVVAGAEVALRALRPRMGLRPGIVRYSSALPDDARAPVFHTLMSLCPGTLPLGADNDGVRLVHCLDTMQDVPTSMAREEDAFRRAFAGP